MSKQALLFKWTTRSLLYCISFFALQTTLEAHNPEKVFAKYPNAVMVETGSFDGNGIQCALNAGFKQINSIELSPKYHQICVERFAKNPNVILWLGDSAKKLPEVIKNINVPITFWLDGHCSSGDTARGPKYSPIMEELEAIKQHPIKTHTILIDDCRLMGTYAFDNVTLQQIILKVMEINPNYVLSFEDGHAKNDVLVAQVKK